MSDNLILSEHSSLDDVHALQVFTEEELEKEHDQLKKIQKTTQKVLKDRYDLRHISKMTIQDILVHMTNKTIDVFKELSDLALHPRSTQYHDSFQWWKKYVYYGSKTLDILKKDDRMTFFGLFLVTLALVLNMFSMT